MRRPTHPNQSRRPGSGFTLIELMVAVVVLGVLVAVALPAFQGALRKSRRSEGFAAISGVQQAQERSRGNFTAYCDDAHLDTAPVLPPDPNPVCGLGVARTTRSGYYTLALSGNSATAYTVTATAHGTQAGDASCALLAVRVVDGNVTYGGGSAIDWTAANPDPGRCWAR